MISRILTSDDYSTLYQWWIENRFTPPPVEMLPENGKGGLMVISGNTPVCAGFVYLTNSKCAWIEWIVADFNYREEDRDEAILFLLESLKSLAKQLGFVYIYSNVKNKHLVSKYESCGFVKGDSNSQELIIKL